MSDLIGQVSQTAQWAALLLLVSIVLIVLAFVAIHHRKLMVERLLFAVALPMLGIGLLLVAVNVTQIDLMQVSFSTIASLEGQPMMYGAITAIAGVFLGVFILGYALGHANDAPQRKRTVKIAEKKAIKVEAKAVKADAKETVKQLKPSP